MLSENNHKVINNQWFMESSEATTYLPSTVRGMFFYLFAVIDLYSRKLVAWEVHASENGELAAELLERARWRARRRRVRRPAP